MTNTELSTRPSDVAEIIRRGGIHVIDATAPVPGAVRVTVLPGCERWAVNALIRAGYDAARTAEQTITATLPEPTGPYRSLLVEFNLGQARLTRARAQQRRKDSSANRAAVAEARAELDTVLDLYLAGAGDPR